MRAVVVDVAQQSKQRVSKTDKRVTQTDQREADEDREGRVRESGWISK
jgi:hypothetical protein